MIESEQASTEWSLTFALLYFSFPCPLYIREDVALKDCAASIIFKVQTRKYSNKTFHEDTVFLVL